MSFCVCHNGGEKGKNQITVSDKKSGEIFFTKEVQLEDTLPLRRHKKKVISNFGWLDKARVDLPIDIIVEINNDLTRSYNNSNLNINAINGAKHKMIFFGDINQPLFFDYTSLTQDINSDRSDFLLVTHITYNPKTKTLKEKLLLEVSLTKTASKLFNPKAIENMYNQGRSGGDVEQYFEDSWEKGVKNRFKHLECKMTDKQAEMIFPFLMKKLFDLAPAKIQTRYMVEGVLFFDVRTGETVYEKTKCGEYPGRKRANIPYHPLVYLKILELDAVSRIKRHIVRRKKIFKNYVNAILEDLSNPKSSTQDFETTVNHIVESSFIQHKHIFFNLKEKNANNLPNERARTKFAYTIYLLRESETCTDKLVNEILEKTFEFLRIQYITNEKAEKVISMLKQDIERVSKKGFFEVNDIDMPNMPRISLLLNPANIAVFSEKGISIKIITKDGKKHLFKEFAEGKIKLKDISKIWYMKGKKVLYSNKELPTFALDVISEILPYDEIRVKAREMFKYYIDHGNRLNILECWSDEREFEYDGEIFTGREIYNLVRRVYGDSTKGKRSDFTNSVKRVLEDIVETEYEKGLFKIERRIEIERKYSYKYISPDLKKARHEVGYATEIFVLASIKKIIHKKYPGYHIVRYTPKYIEGLYTKKPISTNKKGSSKRVNDEMRPDFTIVIKRGDKERVVFIESKSRRKLNSSNRLDEKIIEQYEGVDPKNVLVVLSTWQGIERPELDNQSNFEGICERFKTCFTNEFYEILTKVEIEKNGIVINMGEEYKKFISNPPEYVTNRKSLFNLIKDEFRITQTLPGF